jgi:uncharacterized protein (TIGR03067 family)
MRASGFVFAVLPGLLFGAPSSAQGQGDKDKVQGKWMLLDMTTPQKQIKPNEPEYWIFDGDRVSDQNGDRVRKGTFSLDDSQNPKQINFAWENGKEPGIYLLNGDELAISSATNVTDFKSRPKGFKPRAENEVVRRFRRVK